MDRHGPLNIGLVREAICSRRSPPAMAKPMALRKQNYCGFAASKKQGHPNR